MESGLAKLVKCEWRISMSRCLNEPAGGAPLLSRRRFIARVGKLGTASASVWLMTAHETSSAMKASRRERVPLPPPAQEARITVAEALQARRSVRDFTEEPLSLAQISRLLWSAQGITAAGGFRTAPSAGALYPLELYLVAGITTDLAEGVYRYDPQGQELEVVATGDRRGPLSDAALSQHWIGESAAVIVVAAVPARTTRKYGERGYRYVQLEAGHAAQNIYLQAVSLGLGTTTVGAFHDDRVKAVLAMPEEVQPLCLLPLGRPR